MVVNFVANCILSFLKYFIFFVFSRNVRSQILSGVEAVMLWRMALSVLGTGSPQGGDPCGRFVGEEIEKREGPR
jgi:hypothetical protein